MTHGAEKGPQVTGKKEFVGDLGRSGEGERQIAVCGMGCGDRVRGVQLFLWKRGGKGGEGPEDPASRALVFMDFKDESLELV